MNIQLYRPHSLILQNFIKFFYILTKSEEEENVTYLTFPSIYSMVSISRYASIKTSGNKVTVEFNAGNELESRLAVRYVKPLLIEYAGAANEITICFKPLALNAFLDHPVNYYTKNDSILDVFIPFDDFSERMKAVMLLQKNEEKIAAMEIFWMSKLKGVVHPFLYQALNDMLLPNNEEMAIAEIAGKYKVSQKTLIKHFEQQIGKTPSDFRKIVRFRNALKIKSMESRGDNLTDITYVSHYFDQSHMVKDFKVLTGFTPKEFFRKLSSSHDGKINWIFLGEG